MSAKMHEQYNFILLKGDVKMIKTGFRYMCVFVLRTLVKYNWVARH